MSSLNRVIRNAAMTAAPKPYGHGAPVLVDEYMAELLEQARAEGFEAGHREGFAAGRADMAEAAGRVAKAVGSAAADLIRMRSEAVHAAIESALEIAEFVIGLAPHDDGDALTARIEDALQLLDDEQLAVVVNPRDWDVVRNAVSLPNGVSIERDPSLLPGEARIVGRWATAELTREAALAVAREVLL